MKLAAAPLAVLLVGTVPTEPRPDVGARAPVEITEWTVPWPSTRPRDPAVDAQGRALEALRRGAQSLAQQMQQGQGQGPGPGQPSRTGQARANQDTDPLGRPLRGRDYGDDVTVKVPGEIDVQRARRILEELRKRFADPLRPQLELDYIERLLKDF